MKGNYKCTANMEKVIGANPDKIKAPWELDYCTDCSGFYGTIYACGAKQKASRGTSTLFGCDAKNLNAYHPIARSETKPGDMVVTYEI